MKEKSQIKDSDKNILDTKSYSKDFREQVIEVYKSRVYSSIADCARSYNVPLRVFYQCLKCRCLNFWYRGAYHGGWGN